ncbi:MAG: methyltransferase domain-containing protein [Proteobacteria bacterium]|nr:methyltransferase domain-containing protein [Pseudomonadota bacterium]
MKAEKPDNQQISSPMQIQMMARGFQNSRILLTAFELELFTALDGGAQTSAEVAGKMDTDPRATDRLMNALCSLGLIDKADGLFVNTDFASRCLVKDKEEYVAGLSHINNLWDTWSGLTGAIIRNESKSEQVKKRKEENWYDSFIAAMHNRAETGAPAAVAQLDMTGAKRVLDVGGGSGAFSIQFVKQNEGLSATVYDLPHVVEMAKRYVAEAGVSDRVGFTGGDYTKDSEIGSGYDLAFLSAIIHSNSPETNRDLIDKCYRALTPGGRIVVQDFIMDDDRTTPMFGAIFALNMLVGTQHGDTFTETEIAEWMTSAGFSDIGHLEPLGPVASVIGTKGS